MFPDEPRTPRLLLRPVTSGDAAAIFDAYAGDAAVTRFVTWRPYRSVADTQAYLDGCLAADPAASCTYLLTACGDDAVLGALDLRRPATHRMEFGYVLARPCWGRGLMPEALGAAVAWALAQRDVFRIGSVCDVENRASARVMEKAGPTREGLLRRWLVHPNIGGEPRDCSL